MFTPEIRPVQEGYRIASASKTEIRSFNHRCTNARQNWSTDGPPKLFVDNNDVDDSMIDLPKGVRLGDIELAGARRRGGFNLTFPALAGRCHWDKFRHPPLDGAPVRRGQAFRQADFPNTP